MHRNTAATRLWTSDYLRIFLVNLLLMTDANMLPSVFSMFLLARRATQLEVGLAAYLFSFSAMLMRPVAGWLLDHRSRRRVLLFCTAGQILIPWFYTALPVVALLLVNRAIHGALYAAAGTGVTTNAYDTLSAEHFSEGVGYFGFSNAIATAIGPGLGLYLWDRWGALPLFAALSAVAAAALLLLRGFHFQNVPAPAPLRGAADGSALDFLLERRALPASLLLSYVAVVSGAMSTYAAIFLKEGGFASPGIYYVFQALGTFFSRFFVGRISDRQGERPLVFSSTVLFLGGIALILFSRQALPVYLGALLMGVAYGFTVTGLQIMSVRIVPPERRGAAASTYSCAWDIFAALGGLFSGILVTFFPYRTMFCILAAANYPLFLLTYVLWVSKHASAFRVYRASHGA